MTDAEIKAQEAAYKPRIHHNAFAPGDMLSTVSFNGKSYGVSTRPRPGLRHESGQPVWQTAIVRNRRFLPPMFAKMWRAGSHVGDAAKAEDYHLWIVTHVALEGPERIARIVQQVNA